MPRLMGVRWPDSWVYAVSTQRLDEGGRAGDGTRVYCEQFNNTGASTYSVPCYKTLLVDTN